MKIHAIIPILFGALLLAACNESKSPSLIEIDIAQEFTNSFVTVTVNDHQAVSGFLTTMSELGIAGVAKLEVEGKNVSFKVDVGETIDRGTWSSKEFEFEITNGTYFAIYHDSASREVRMTQSETAYIYQ